MTYAMKNENERGSKQDRKSSDHLFDAVHSKTSRHLPNRVSSGEVRSLNKWCSFIHLSPTAAHSMKHLIAATGTKSTCTNHYKSFHIPSFFRHFTNAKEMSNYLFSTSYWIFRRNSGALRNISARILGCCAANIPTCLFYNTYQLRRPLGCQQCSLGVFRDYLQRSAAIYSDLSSLACHSCTTFCWFLLVSQ